MIKTQLDDIYVNGKTYYAQLPEENVFKSVGQTTPNVSQLTLLVFQNTGAVSVTDLVGGNEGNELRIIGDGFTTLVFNTRIVTNTGANKLLAANKYYSFTMFNKVWIEHA